MNNKNKYIIGILIAIIIISLIIVFLNNTRTEDGAMLNFTGEDYKQAEFFADQYSLNLNITWEDSNEYAYGKVISQSIPKGKVVAKGEDFNIVVSNGNK